MKTSIIYILHFSGNLSHARHYLGSTNDLESRVTEHRRGSTAKIVDAAKKAGLEFSAHFVQFGNRKVERQLKRRRNHRRLCPLCATDRKAEYKKRNTKRKEANATKHASTCTH